MPGEFELNSSRVASGCFRRMYKERIASYKGQLEISWYIFTVNWKLFSANISVAVR